MADNVLAVDPQALARAAPPTRDLAQHILDVRTALRARLDELGEPWGDDQTGRQFLEQYAGPRNDLLRGFESIFEVLDSMADGIETMAHGFRQVEEQNIEALKSLKKGVAGAGPTGEVATHSHGGKHA